MRLTAREVRPLDDVVRDAASELVVRIASAGAIERLRAMLDGAGKGRGRVTLVIEDDAREIAIRLPGGYALDPAMSLALGAVEGILAVNER